MSSKQQDSIIGSTIDGYFIEELLGRGGMARVYRAIDVRLKRYAAFKVIDYSSHQSADYEERFNREARAIAKLNHPNIVSLYRFEEFNDMYFMAMEYIDGADLRWVLQDYQMDAELMDYDTVIQIMQQISDALDYAHKNGVIHRDIKPSNIMISREGRAILTDFGLALDVAEGTQGEIFGSPHYIAPEQAINSKTVQPQTDLYSLGVVLYEILTGIVPYHEGTTFEIALQHINTELPNPQDVNPKLHSAFIPVLKKALAKEIKNRYQTCNDMMKDLKEAVKTATQSKRIPALDTRSRPSQRIALKVVPLPAAVVNERTKPPTILADNIHAETLPSIGSRDLNKEPADNQAESATKLGKEKSLPKQKNRLPILLGVIILLIVTIGGYGALDYYGILSIPGLSGISNFGSSSVNTPNGIIEGRVESINGRTIMIYDMPVLLDREEELLDIPPNILIDRMLRVEGQYTVATGGVEFTEITSLEIDKKTLEEFQQEFED